MTGEVWAIIIGIGVILACTGASIIWGKGSGIIGGDGNFG